MHSKLVNCQNNLNGKYYCTIARSWAKVWIIVCLRAVWARVQRWFYARYQIFYGENQNIWSSVLWHILVSLCLHANSCFLQKTHLDIVSWKEIIGHSYLYNRGSRLTNWCLFLERNQKSIERCWQSSWISILAKSLLCPVLRMLRAPLNSVLAAEDLSA